MGELSRLSSLLGFLKDRALPSAPTANSIADLLRAVEKRAADATVTNSIAARIAGIIGAPAWLTSGTTVVPIVTPSLAAGAAATTGTTAWTYGAWAQIVAANVLEAHVITGFAFERIGLAAASDDLQQFQLGTGAAGSEVVIATYKVSGIVISAGSVEIVLINPFLKVVANARVSWRAASNTVNGTSFNLSLIAYPRDL